MECKKLLHAMIFLLPTILLSVGCNGTESEDRSLLIPVGRSAVVGGSSFQVLIDAIPYDPQVTYDEYGGYWIDVPYDSQENSEVLLRITIEDEQPDLYHQENQDLQRWLAPSELIDSDNSVLVAQAQKLTENTHSAIEKARSIQRFVIGHLEFRIYSGHFRHKASDTYKMRYGTCVNYARLFVALSRAVDLPARTVWGIIYNNGEYDYHHEWAEFLDDDGYWHPLDFTFTTSFDLSDIRYLDLIYSSEENPLYEQSRSERYRKNRSQIIVYDTSELRYDGRLGFKLVDDNSPDSLVVENLFILADIPSLIPQKVP
ncbi:MAG: transglutaminase domain-containing protein [Chloroflexota bacterium]